MKKLQGMAYAPRGLVCYNLGDQLTLNTCVHLLKDPVCFYAGVHYHLFAVINMKQLGQSYTSPRQGKVQDKQGLEWAVGGGGSVRGGNHGRCLRASRKQGCGSSRGAL